jgi:lysyl-tRNA synthetase class 1
VARDKGIEPPDLFKTIYQVLLGQDRGPRFGTFTKLIGKDRMKDLIQEKI